MMRCDKQLASKRKVAGTERVYTNDLSAWEEYDSDLFLCDMTITVPLALALKLKIA